MQINGLEIFSGAGGLAKGIEMAGITHTGFIEWNSYACKTLRWNYPPEIVHEGDIRDVELSAYGNIDFIAGGPPCQPFSLGGKALGCDDTRDMFPYAINTIRELTPKAFLFENVKGLLRASFRDYFNYILLQLSHPGIIKKNSTWREHYDALQKIDVNSASDLKYDVCYALVNAADYGIPQKRERVIIVGIRSDLNLSWCFPPQTHSCLSLLWSKYMTEEYWEKHDISPSDTEFAQFPFYKKQLQDYYGLFAPELAPWVTIRDALSNSPAKDSKNYFPSEHEPHFGAKEYDGHTGSHIDEPSKTIKAGAHGVPGGENMVKLPNGDVRYLTVFEAKRIQTFPDDYHITGSWTEAMRQIGNAVPVKLGQIMASSLLPTVFSSPT